MSKYLILLSALFTFQAFAQDVDFEPVVCDQEQSCIRTTTPAGNQSHFKLIEIFDVDGQSLGKKLSSSSAINDIFYDGIIGCYQGNIADACDMGELMAGATNLDYSQGGHASVTAFKCYALDRVVNFEYDLHSDYSQDPIPTKVSLEVCQ